MPSFQNKIKKMQLSIATSLTSLAYTSQYRLVQNLSYGKFQKLQ
jgi:hypothetical protein